MDENEELVELDGATSILVELVEGCLGVSWGLLQAEVAKNQWQLWKTPLIHLCSRKVMVRETW